MGVSEENNSNGNYVVERAKSLLRKSLAVLEDRDKSYNGNGINFHDYKLLGLESTFEDILENFVRLSVSQEEDNAIDWICYSALQASFVQEGLPQSRFSPIFVKMIPKIYAKMKENDCGYSKVI